MRYLTFILLITLIVPPRPAAAELAMPDQNITLNFQNTDIDLVLKFFSDLTGTVFIKSDLVRGFITLAAPQKVTPAEGLDILQTVLELKGFVIVPGPGKMMRVLSQAEALQVDLDVQVGRGSNSLMQGDRMLTQVVPLKFSSAPELKQQLAPMLSKSGSLISDDRTNALIITDLASNIRRLLQMIESLDVRTPQVLIEALIVEASLNKETKFGIEWSHNFSFDAHDNTFSGKASQNFNLGSAIGEGFKYSILRADNNVSALLQMLATDTNVNILSTPRIMTINNQAAMIRVGEEVPVLTQTRNIIGGETIQSYDYKSVAVELEVTPRINFEREIVLKVHPTIKKILGYNTELNAPTLATREAQTTVVLDDGQTVVIGGLMKDDHSLNQSKIPILGDIPIIGNLFKQRGSSSDKTELLVFITPHVITNTREAKAMTIEQEAKTKQVPTPFREQASEHDERAWDYYKEDKYQEAILEWERVIELSPDPKMKKRAIKRIQQMQKKIKKAQKK